MPSLSSCGISYLRNYSEINRHFKRSGLETGRHRYVSKIPSQHCSGISKWQCAACCLSLFLLPAAVIIHVHNKAQIVVKESQVPKYPAACYQAAAGMLNKSFSVCQSYTLFDTVCCCCLFALLLQHGQLGYSHYMQTPKKRSKMAA